MLRLLIFCILLLKVDYFLAQAQWQPITSIYGTNITEEYAETSNKVVARGIAGLYLADKTDFFWEIVPAFIDIDILAIDASADTIFVIHRGSDSDFRIFLTMSFDEGATWEERALVSENSYFDIELSYVANQLVIATASGGNGLIVKSNDLGQSWTTEPMPAFIEYVMKTFDSDDSHITYMVGSTDTSRCFIYSVFDGVWHAIPGTNTTGGLITAYIYNNRVYTAVDGANDFSIYTCALDGSDNQVLYSNAATLQFQGFIEVNGSMAFLIHEPTTPIDAEDLYVSNDNGQTFTYQATLSNAPVWWDVVEPLESGQSIVRSGTDLWLMSADFQTYQSITNGMILLGLKYVTSINNVIYTANYGEFFGRSANDGLTFEDLSAVSTSPMGGILQQGDTILYETGDNYSSVYSFFRSFDNGGTFDSLPVISTSDVYYNEANQKSVILNNKIYTIFFDLFDFPTILKSEDYGESWTEIPNPADVTGILHVVNGKMYYLGEDLYQYNEQSNSWLDLNSPIVNENIFFVHNCKMRSMGDNLWISNESNEQIVLLADGSTWVTPNTSLNDVVQIGNTIYGLGTDFLYASTDFGQTWQSTEITVPVGAHTKMTSHGSQLLVYGGIDPTASIWRIEAPQVVSGVVYYDANNNGSRDIGEPGVPNVLIHSQNSETYSMSGVTGSFNISFNGIEDQLTVEVNNAQYVALPQNFTVNNFDEVMIGIRIIGSIADLEIDAVLASPFRPGFSTTIYTVVNNLGNVAQGGELTLTLPQLTTFTSSSIQPSNQTSNSVTWTISELAPFETRLIFIELLNDVSAVLGNTATFNLNLISASNDDNLDNNTLSNSSIIVGSYDPNDKACSRGESLTPTQLNENNEFEYLIRFQNTGTYYAENVVIQDTISSYFDLSTMRIIATSDTMNVTFGENNLVNFNFPLIFLPDSTTNEPESHGFVKYAIRTKPNLQLGTVLKNTAYIYFDFNEPIITNTTETVFDLPIGIEFNEERDVLIYPNPTNAAIKLVEYVDQTVTVSLADLSGKLVLQKTCTNGELDLSTLQQGVYLGNIEAAHGKPARRFKVVKM